MLPSLPRADVANQPMADAVFFRDVSLRLSRRESSKNRNDRRIGQLAGWPSRSDQVSAVHSPVKAVFDVRSPRQVVDPVVSWVPIEMSTLHAGRSKANESFEHNSVNPKRGADSGLLKDDVDVAAPLREEPHKPRNTARTLHAHQRPYSSKAARFVEAFEARNRSPLFPVQAYEGRNRFFGSVLSPARLATALEPARLLAAQVECVARKRQLALAAALSWSYWTVAHGDSPLWATSPAVTSSAGTSIFSATNVRALVGGSAAERDRYGKSVC